MSLRVVDPIDITDSILSSSDIPEPDTSKGEVEWEAPTFVNLFPIENTTHRLDSYKASVIRSGENGIFVSNDNGETYSNPYTSLCYGCCIDRSDESVMYFTTLSEIYKSTDGGASFSSITIPAVGGVIWAISADDNRVVAVGGVGICLVSNDSGASFSLVNIGAGSTKLTDVDINDIYTLACDIAGNVYYSFSNHASWTKIATGYTGELYSTAYYNGYSFISGQNGFLSISSDGGTSWSTITSHLPYSKNIYEIAMSESGYLCIPAAVDGALVSTNLGNSWVEMKGGKGQLSGVVTINDDYVYSDGFSSGGNVNKYKIYRVGDNVVDISTHRKLQCLVALNQDNPTSGATEDANATWIDVGPTNKWAMFDEKTTTLTTSTTNFSITLSPVDYVNTIGFFRVIGVDEINITVIDSNSTERYNKDTPMLDISSIYDYYTFFFYQNVSSDELIVDDLPPYYNPEITITFTGSDMSIGAIVFGFASQIGDSLSGTQTENLDYSRQEYDEFGEIVYIERPIVKLNTYEILSKKSTNPYIQSLIRRLKGKNTLWIGDIGSGQKLVTYGRYERSPIPFTMVNDVRYSITVKGSI
jgi:hypothetical protein